MTRLAVNGAVHDIPVDTAETLLATLRNRLGLTGTKYGCGVGECGSCTVLISGRPRLACVTLTETVTAEVETVEVLTERAPEIQSVFAGEGGFQCGYCTPGQLMTIYGAVLADADLADDAALRHALSGNICRCTGYAGIVRALRRSLRPNDHIPDPDRAHEGAHP